MAAMFLNEFYTCFLPSFGSLGKVVSEMKICRNRPISNNKCLLRPCLLMGRDEMSNLHRGPSINSSYHDLAHFAQRFQRRFFLNRPIRNKNCLWRPCLLMDRDKMSILYKGPSIDASYQVSVHLAEGFQRTAED